MGYGKDVPFKGTSLIMKYHSIERIVIEPRTKRARLDIYGYPDLQFKERGGAPVSKTGTVILKGARYAFNEAEHPLKTAYKQAKLAGPEWAGATDVYETGQEPKPDPVVPAEEEKKGATD